MEKKQLSAALFSLLDRQRYEENPRLSALIADTERRWGGETALSDEALSLVSAAGEVHPSPRRRAEDGE